ncbi:MAG: hypothetical protein LH614_17790 [Pyrinomonadaceae bacterium]|nr:hypothetical protein [Pyrinomonadaceae bacterium]
MNKSDKVFNFFYSKLLSEKTKDKSETIIVSIAIVCFILHLLLIALVDLNVFQLRDYSKLLSSPIAAIYTPFSFILVYEVYLLVYYLPKSTSTYIGKQYEIIALIIIRRVFKDLSHLEFTLDWFNEKNDLQFTYDLAATIILFFLIFIFYRLNQKKEEQQTEKKPFSPAMAKFIKLKNIIAMCLIPVFLILAVYSFGHWVYESFFSITQMVDSIKDINKIFFDDFFLILILTDVLLLLFSFLHTDRFSKVIRNSGFIISTILLKLSFGAEGILNTILIIVAVLFGVTILAIHNQYEKIIIPNNT